MGRHPFNTASHTIIYEVMEKKKRTQPKQTHNQRLGKWGEDAAWRYLEEQGVEMLAANVRTQYGEIDLIGREGGALVFFEV